MAAADAAVVAFVIEMGKKGEEKSASNYNGKYGGKRES